jgi:hypothetical protein
MPFIVEARQPLTDGERVVVAALESVGTRVVVAGQPIVSRHTAATLEEARRVGRRLLADHNVWPTADVDNLPAAGGTVGPLPDGTTIEVRPTP